MASWLSGIKFSLVRFIIAALSIMAFVGSPTDAFNCNIFPEIHRIVITGQGKVGSDWEGQ